VERVVKALVPRKLRMTLSLETDIGYLFEANGRRQNGKPECFLDAVAPVRTGRGRERDQLLLQLHFQSGAPEAPPQSELLALAHRHYFGTPGSVTAAARAAINAVNGRLLDGNRAGGGVPLQAGLTCAVMRASDLYVTQAGPGKTLVLRKENAEQFPERMRTLRPIGMADKTEVHYYHTMLGEGDLLWMGRLGPVDGELTSMRVSGNGDWHESLACLREMTNGNAPALLCRFCAPGERGQLAAALAAGAQVAAVVDAPTSAKPNPEPDLALSSTALETDALNSDRQPPAHVPPEVTRDGAVAAVPELEAEVAPQGSFVSQDRATGSAHDRMEVSALDMMPLENEPVAMVESPVEPEANLAPAQEAVAPTQTLPDCVAELAHVSVTEIEGLSADVLKPMMVSAASQAEPKKRVGRPQKQKKARRQSQQPALPTAGDEPAVARVRQWYLHLPLAAFQDRLESGAESLNCFLGNALHKVLARVLPGPDLEVQMRSSALLWFAAGVPVLVVVLTITAYIQFGRAREFNYYLDEARAAATLAREAPDAAQGVPQWRQVIVWSDQADDIRGSHPEVAALQQAAQDVLDETDRVERVRVDAITADGFRTDANLVKILARGPSVYALDEANQAVYRAVLTTSGDYQLDPVFECRRGPVGMQSIDALVDITWLSRPNVVGQDTLLALDPGGRLLYCTTDGAMAATVLTPPYDGWTGSVAIEAFQNRIYVLEPDANEIWVYQREDKFFADPPERFFSESAIDLSAAIDISIVQGTVFILHRDGHMTQCVRREQGVAPECSIETRYSDGRPGRGDDIRFDGVDAPAAMVVYPPPHSSLYLTDLNSPGAYQFSLRLAYQREFRAVDDDGEVAATSFAVGSGRDLFFARGNNVYVGRRR